MIWLRNGRVWRWSCTGLYQIDEILLSKAMFEIQLHETTVSESLLSEVLIKGNELRYLIGQITVVYYDNFVWNSHFFPRPLNTLKSLIFKKLTQGLFKYTDNEKDHSIVRAKKKFSLPARILLPTRVTRTRPTTTTWASFLLSWISMVFISRFPMLLNNNNSLTWRTLNHSTNYKSRESTHVGKTFVPELTWRYWLSVGWLLQILILEKRKNILFFF